MTRDETTSEEKSSRSYWGFVLWPVAVVVLYVLSAGPALLAYHKALIPRSLLHAYRPLHRVLAAASLEKPFGVYLHLWCPDAYNKDGSAVAWSGRDPIVFTGE